MVAGWTYHRLRTYVHSFHPRLYQRGSGRAAGFSQFCRWTSKSGNLAGCRKKFEVRPLGSRKATSTKIIFMPRPVTLFTGQWAHLSFEVMCQKAKSFGYDGLELACWGDHFDVSQGAKDKTYCDSRHEILARNQLKTWAI